jgi:hypothetical protein
MPAKRQIAARNRYQLGTCETSMLLRRLPFSEERMVIILGLWSPKECPQVRHLTYGVLWIL